MSSSQAGRSGSGDSRGSKKGKAGQVTGSSNSRGSKKGKDGQVTSSVQQLIDSLETHRVNTLTELCRIERVAATTDNEEDARAFQAPITAAWGYYVSSNQMLTELHGLTRAYPFSGEVLADAVVRVRNDPNSNRSWNLAWLCLVKIQDDDLISSYAASTAARPEMWGPRVPEQEEVNQLAQCFEFEWNRAIEMMLRHWTIPPTWY